MAIKPEHRLKVGAWEYLPERDKLVKFDANGQLLETAELDNLCQNVMNFLMVHAGELVSKDDLLEKVWGIRAVSDGRITRVIRVLRVALGDDSRTPIYIETVPKRGYRLIAPVERSDVTGVSTESEQVEETSHDVTVATSKPAGHWQRRTLLSLLVLMPIVLAGYFWLATNSVEDDFSAIPLWRYEPVTFLDGIEFYHSISPDEELLVFSYASSPSDSVVRLKLQNLRTHQVVALTDAPYSSFGAAWSPDATQLAYQRTISGSLCEIRILTLNAARDQVISDELLTNCGALSISARLSWSPDGRFLVYPSREEGQSQMALMLYPLAGGQPQMLTAPPATGFGDYAVRFSRDGNNLAFLRDSASTVQIWLMDLNNRSSRMLRQLSDTSPGNIDWSLDSSEILYPAGRSRLAAVNVFTNEQRLVAYTDLNASEIQISPSGRILASVGAFSQLNILQIPNAIENSSSERGQQVFSSNRNEAFAVASPVPNGPIAVVSRRSGLPQVWLFYPNGKQQQLTDFQENERVSRLVFSPDGRRLLALVSQELWLFEEGVKPQRIVGAASRQNIANPSWSSDGSTIYYAKVNQGSWQVMSVAVDAPSEVHLFNAQMEFYLESPDGRYRFWRNSFDRWYYLERLEADGSLIKEQIMLPKIPLHFELATTGLYYSAYQRDNHYQLYYFDFSNQKVRVATDLDSVSSSHFSLSSDRNYFFLPSMGRGDMDIAEISLQQQNL
ncbi:winged helix-turn-helix domain-containing protein [Alkalimonas sp. MEB108]|uniref:Winged helix-turn-helix domain-containing protein n=1 Tax=Alkalimonas cellulosilytica TaxID=3058395 RepID=A0ABU7J402_9GAMM|nr:winged helix-turn-helix domain-containing protein [Alkalimonas sp. MEB108]MEE2001098.1 winged helix-turn-helix domain-containing protein [Alkalimonas sp. MEB108]